jgi:hypothetical protein
MYFLYSIEKIRNEQSSHNEIYENEIKRLNEKIIKLEELFDDKLEGIIENEDFQNLNANANVSESLNGSVVTVLENEINNHFLLETEDKDIDEIVLCPKLLKENFSSQENFYCKICLNIVVNVTQCNNCENLFCRKCIDNLINSDENCPSCKQIFTEGVIPKITKNILNNFILQCPYNCDEFLKYSNIFPHLKDCNNRGKVFSCIECNEKILVSKQNEENYEKILLDHMGNCPEKITNCIFCRKSIKRRELQIHLDSCEEKTIKCEKCFFVYPLKMTLSNKHDDIHCIEIKRLRKNLELFVKKNGI